MRIIFIGTPEIALLSLKALMKEHDVVCVVTSTDKPTGRSGKPVMSPIAEFALLSGLNCIKPNKLDDQTIDYLKSLDADYFVTFAYGKIFREQFLSIAKFGGVNIHPSLLPEYRGPSPIQSALLDGKKTSGITVQKIVFEVDSGAILKQIKFDIEPNDTIITLEQKIATSSAIMICEVMKELEEGCCVSKEQQHDRATCCRKLVKSDSIIDWSEDADIIHNKIRAYCRWPIAKTTIDGKNLSILHSAVVDFEFHNGAKPGTIVSADKLNGIIVACGKGTLKILSLQLEGKKELSPKEFINGYRDLLGKVFE